MNQQLKHILWRVYYACSGKSNFDLSCNRVKLIKSVFTIPVAGVAFVCRIALIRVKMEIIIVLAVVHSLEHTAHRNVFIE